LPPEFGDAFSRPSRDVIARERGRKGERLFTPAQIHLMLEKSPAAMKAMILLGVGNGLGNADIGRLEFRHLDLEGGWLTYPRPKTGVRRRSKLWPETIAALQAWLKVRQSWINKRPLRDALRDLVFITRTRQSFTIDGRPDTILTRNFTRLIGDLKIRQPGLSFYTLRHTYRTVADDCLDQPAINHTMGHRDATMAGNYRQRIKDERLEAVSHCVHRWLYGEGGADNG
jgi:integrase